MATSGTFAFVETLQKPTSENIIRWKVSDINPNTFNCQIKIKDNGILRNVNIILDKYQTVDNDNLESTCINFAIIENNSSQLVNLVRCANNEGDYLREYNLLSTLYDKVKINKEHFDTTLDFSMAF